MPPTSARPSAFILNIPALLLLALPAQACSPRVVLPPATATSSDGIVIYPTGIETRRLDNGIIAVFDHQVLYGMGFPENWVVGAFDDVFVPTVQEYGRINWGVQGLFETIYPADPSLRIYAIDTSPEHLNEDSMAVIHIGTPGNAAYRNVTLDELVAEYLAYLQADGRVSINQTLVGKSNFDIPFVILLTDSHPQDSQPVYGASVLIQTDTAYVELLYTTLDPAINIVDELSPILASLGTFVE